MSLQWKILPALILVAMLAFSVRMIEVVGGFTTLTHAGSALAEEEKAAAEKAEAKPAEKTAEADHKDAAKADEKAGEKPAATVAKDAAADDATKWPDAGDAEMDLSATRMQVVKDLVARRAALDKRESDLNTREALMKAAGQELDQKFKELTSLRTDIEGLLKQQSEEEKARSVSLVKIYEGMKPKDAARIFDTLDLDILLSVMTNMSAKKLSPILAAMNAERARTITIMMAEQKKLPTLPLSN